RRPTPSRAWIVPWLERAARGARDRLARRVCAFAPPRTDVQQSAQWGALNTNRSQTVGVRRRGRSPLSRVQWRCSPMGPRDPNEGQMTQPEEESSSELTWDDIPKLMDELQDLAKRLLRRWPGTDSLQPTLLVNTALRRQRRENQAWEDVTWQTRAQFFSQVFRAMRHKLVE